MNMKVNIISVSSIVGGLTLTSALAIEPPPDNAAPPVSIAGEDVAKKPALEIAPRESIPFLGLSTAAVPSMVADHLDLDAGKGVIVRTVCPDSPAEKAGLSMNDIILKAGGNEISSPEEFSFAVRDKETGERLDLDLIHRGKPAKVTVTLAERPEGLAANSNPRQGLMLEGLPKAHADQLRDMIDQNLQAFGHDPLPGMDGDPFREMRERMNRAMNGIDIPPVTQGADGSVRFQQNSTVRMMDGDGSVEIKSSGKNTEVTVRDQANQIVWTGPWDTEQDKAGAPDDIRQRIDRINSGKASGFTFRFGRAPGKAGAPE